MIDTIVLQLCNISRLFPKLDERLRWMPNGSWHYVHSSETNTTTIEHLNGKQVDGYTDKDGEFHEPVAYVGYKPFINMDTGEMCNLPFGCYQDERVNVYKNKDGYKERKMGKRGEYKAGSGHYHVKYLIDDEKDTCSFSFSIPKFLYGTNVMQFVEPTRSPQYNQFLGNSWDWNRDNTYRLLMRFIPYFYETLFTPFARMYGLQMMLEQTKITRIDVCYNQIFPTEEAARDTQKMMKFIRKKYSRTGFMGNFQNDNILYSNSRVSYKIYHKGDEFKKKGDKRHLDSMNRATGKLLFNTAVLQDIADRTLRYEMTVHSKYLSYLHMTYIFRSRCPVHQYRKTAYNTMLTKIAAYNAEKDQVQAGQYEPLTMERIAQIRAQQKIKKIEFDYVKDYAKAFGKRCEFYPFPRKDLPIKHVHTWSAGYLHTPKFREQDWLTARVDMQNDDLRAAPFTYELLCLCIDKLKLFVNEYKLEERPEFISSVKNLTKYNEKCVIEQIRIKKLLAQTSDAFLQSHYKAELKKNSKVSEATIKPLLLLLDTGISFDEACEKLDTSPQTKHNWRATLKKIGYSTTATMEESYHVSDDFSTYNNAIKNKNIYSVYSFFTARINQRYD